jgi:hypothetical protein
MEGEYVESRLVPAKMAELFSNVLRVIRPIIRLHYHESYSFKIKLPFETLEKKARKKLTLWKAEID